MRKRTRTYLLGAVVTAMATSLIPANAANANSADPAAQGHGPHAQNAYFTGDYTPSLELYSFNNNLTEWIKNRPGAPPLTTPQVIDWAAQAGFPAVDITAYYIPGYEGKAMPSRSTDQIMQYARDLKAQCARLGLRISGTGVGNDFATPDADARALDVRRVKFWTDVAAEMGAPVIRVFSGPRPSDIHQQGWEKVARTRVVPALKEVTAYAATKGVKVVLQNHGDMTATADQTVQILKWVDNPNLGIIDDTGYFQPFGSESQQDYDWYGDIAQVLPYSDSIQAKLEPAGAGTNPPMDFDRLFTDLRLSSYRGYIPMERLWAKDDPNNPKKMSTPPYDEVAQFYGQVKDALARTKVSPFKEIQSRLEAYATSGELSHKADVQLAETETRAERHFAAGQQDQAMKSMQEFLNQMKELPPSDVAPEAQSTLVQHMADLLQSFHDVFGWPVSLSDTVPTKMLTDSTTSFTTTVRNRTGSAISSAREDVSVLPVNPTPSRSHPSNIPPVTLSPGDVTLQYQAGPGRDGFVDLPLSEGPGGSLTGHLGTPSGSLIKSGVTRGRFRLTVNDIPAGYVRVDLSINQVDPTGSITTAGIATATTPVNVQKPDSTPAEQ